MSQAAFPEPAPPAEASAASGPRSRRMELAGWGNCPREAALVCRPEKLSGVREAVIGGAGPQIISRGLGRSYGDAATNKDNAVLVHTRLDRFISFDPSNGILECEAGVSLADVIDVCLPHGYFPPVTPGTKYVTVGGALAADVHGKNHHRDGSFAEFVLSFDLLTGAGERLHCSRDENADVFWATMGGMGLTGAILSARLRLSPVESAYLAVDYQKSPNLDKTLELFSEGDDRYQYSVAWIDCLAGGESLGRSVLIRGNPARRDELGESARRAPLAAPLKRKRSVPFFFPGFVLNPLSVKAFNARFYRCHRQGRREIGYDEFFYPLDSVLHWNRIYGKRGFYQYQAVFPTASARQGLVQLLEALSASKRASFLAVLKTMGRSSGGLLSFPMAGQTLALDLPNSPGVVEFLRGLDQIVLRHGGRVYLAKDACLEPQSFRAMYPRAGEFAAIRRRLDPSGRFGSSLSRRIEIGAGA